jgi:hypothetical protein
MVEEMGHLNHSKGGGRGIDGVIGRVTSREGATNHIVSFPEVKHVIGKKNG